MYLSYSGYKTYACPKAYWFHYISKPTLELPENRSNSLYGSTVGKLFEDLYNERIWESKGVDKQLEARVQTAYIKAVAKEQKDGVVLWKPQDKKANYADPDAMLADVRATIPRGLRIIRHYRLLGQNAVAEVRLNHEIEGHEIGGRCDFLMRRIGPHHDLILLDGKGSRHRHKYVDFVQLKWYAMLHRVKFGHMPDRLGFVYWRYEPEKALDWVECSLDELDELQAHVVGIVREIAVAKTMVEADASSLPQAFPAKPGGECRFCPYFQLCPEGQKFDALKAPEHVGSGVEDVGL